MLENVLGWEHPPALHDSDFTAVAWLESGEWGWRVRLSRPPGMPKRDQILRLEVQRARNRCIALREAGIGAGGLSWAELECNHSPSSRPGVTAIDTSCGCDRLWYENCSSERADHRGDFQYATS